MRSFLVASLLIGLAIFADASDQGTIKGSRVNVRGQAKLTSEVVTQLNQGDRVTILDEVKATHAGPGEPKRFFKIILPQSTSVWISAKYVKDGKVTATRLNVRSGAGENYSVLGGISKGTSVTEVKTVGDWMEIRSPGGMHGYVATSLVKSDAQPPTVAKSSPVPTPVPPVVPVKAEPIVPVPPPAGSLEVVTVETAAPVVTEPITEPVPMPMPVPATTPAPEIPGGVYSETTVTTTADGAPVPEVKPNELLTPPAEPELEAGDPGYKTLQPSKKKTMLGRWWERVTTGRKKGEATEAAAEGNFHAPPAPAPEGPPAVRVVTREGIVVRAWNIQAPSDWALKEVYTGKIVNYLWSGQKELPWNELRGRTVIVTGEEAIDRRWSRTPVLRIETLKTIDGDGDGEG